MSAPLVVSIGTTHPWNIAGVGLDARVAAEYGVAHAAVIVAVSAQDERGLHGVHALPAQAIAAQLESLPRPAAAFRIGALVSVEAVRVIADFLRTRAASTPAIVDPAIAVTLGGELQTDASLPAALRDELLALPVIVTPNLPEVETLLGVLPHGLEQMAAAGREFVQRGARAALIKGGHLQGEPADVLVTAGEERVYTAARLPGAMRGTGCTLAAALACESAYGRDLPAAVDSARAYVRSKIAARTMRGGLQVAF